MKKIFLSWLLVSACLAFDTNAVKLGFNDEFYQGELSNVVVDAKSTITIDKANESFRCKTLTIDAKGHMEFVKADSIKHADVIVEAYNTIEINGNLTAGANVNLTLISSNISMQNANIKCR